MKTLKSEKYFRLLPFYLVVGLLLSTSSVSKALSEKSVVRVNEEYRIKRAASDKVILYNQKQDNEKKEFVFTEFNADVILLLYRRFDTNYIINSLSKKYHISKTDARRQVKMTIYELENYELVIRK